MATPEAEETVAPPTVAEVVKTAEGGEKETPKAAEDPTKVEEAVKGEEPAAANEEGATPTESEEATEAAPVEEPTVPFKEESNVVADLKESEKKALEEFKARIVKAIENNEFKVPKKPVESLKEPEVVEAPKEVTEEKAAETPAVEAPAADAPATETPAAETLTETPAAEPPAGEATILETPSAAAPVTPKVETLAAAEVLKVETPKAPESVVKEPTVAAVPAVEKPSVDAKEMVALPAEASKSEAEARVPSEDTPVEDTSAEKTEDASVRAAASPETPAVEDEEEEDLTPPEDVSLWGVPLLPSKGDERTDVILLKFLRARDFNVKLAFEQLQKTIIWRKTFKADRLLEEDFGHDFDEVAFDYGKDKDGHPVCYNLYAPFQNKELYAKAFGDPAKLQNFIRWRIQVLEKSLKLLSFSPEGPSALVQVTDLKGFPGLGKKEVRQAYNQAVNILQDNYPELIVKMVFVNVPWYFSALYAFVSPFISARTKSKFSRYTPGRTTEGLLKFILAHNLPVQYGGLSKPNDPHFTGVEGPPTELTIKAGSKETFEIPISEAEGTVVWDLTVVGYDVTYGAEYVPSAEGGYTTIIEKPKKLVSTLEEPVRSSFKFTEAGKVVISIDNAARKKKLAVYRYLIKIPTAES